MRVVLISDTHERHTQIKVPDGDLLIHAGDFTMMGDTWAVKDFNSWLGTLPHPHKVVIAGNHEMDWTPEKAALLTNATYLQDSGCQIEGQNIWGSPYTPTFGHWAFMRRRHEMLKHWLTIPEDTDILITHGPPQGLLDTVTKDSEHCGCADLACVVEAQEPKLHVFGHIHGGYGHRLYKNTLYVNASCVNEAYKPVNAPIVADLIDTPMYQVKLGEPLASSH